MQEPEKSKNVPDQNPSSDPLKGIDAAIDAELDSLLEEDDAPAENKPETAAEKGSPEGPENDPFAMGPTGDSRTLKQSDLLGSPRAPKAGTAGGGKTAPAASPETAKDASPESLSDETFEGVEPATQEEIKKTKARGRK